MVGVLALTLPLVCPLISQATDSPLGIDHCLSYDNSGIWKRSYQKGLMDTLLGLEPAGDLWKGGDTRVGKTFLQSVDARAASAIAATGLKYAFTRARPSQTSDPVRWLQSGSHYGFPSGEVAAVNTIVTPFVLEYRHWDPWVYDSGGAARLRRGRTHKNPWPLADPRADPLRPRHGAWPPHSQP